MTQSKSPVPSQGAAQVPPAEWKAWNLSDALDRPLREEWVGRIHVQPLGLRISVQDGAISSIEGYVTLGELAISERLLTPQQVEEAVAEGGMLGRTLLQKLWLRPQQLQRLLTMQAAQSLQFLREHEMQEYTFEEQPRLPWPHAMLTALDLGLQFTRAEVVAIDHPYRLAAQRQPLIMTPAEWEVLRWVNGRRTLRRAAEISNLPREQALAAAAALLARDLLEPSAIMGLPRLFVRLLPSGTARQPPATIRANLFLKHLGGEQSIQGVIDRLNYPVEEAALLVTGLYRDNLIEVVQGEEEMRRLLEEF